MKSDHFLIISCYSSEKWESETFKTPPPPLPQPPRVLLGIIPRAVVVTTAIVVTVAVVAVLVLVVTLAGHMDINKPPLPPLLPLPLPPSHPPPHHQAASRLLPPHHQDRAIIRIGRRQAFPSPPPQINHIIHSSHPIVPSPSLITLSPSPHPSLFILSSYALPSPRSPNQARLPPSGRRSNGHSSPLVNATANRYLHTYEHTVTVIYSYTRTDQFSLMHTHHSSPFISTCFSLALSLFVHIAATTTIAATSSVATFAIIATTAAAGLLLPVIPLSPPAAAAATAKPLPNPPLPPLPPTTTTTTPTTVDHVVNQEVPNLQY